MKLEITLKDEKLKADYERLRAEFNDLYTEVQGIHANREDSARAQYQVRVGDRLEETAQEDRIFALETKTALLPLSWADLIKRLEKAEATEFSLTLKVDNLYKELAFVNQIRTGNTHTQARIVDEYRVKIEALETLLSSTVASIGHLQSRIDTQSRIAANNSACINDLMKLIPAPKNPIKRAPKKKK